MRKFLSIVLVVIAASACGGSTATESDDASEEEQSLAAEITEESTSRPDDGSVFSEEDAGDGYTIEQERAVADKIAAYYSEGSIIDQKDAACASEKYVKEIGLKRLESLDITGKDVSALDNSNLGFTDNERKLEVAIVEDCIGLENLLAASFQLEVRLEKVDAECAAAKLDKTLFKDTIRDAEELTAKRESDVLQVFVECGVSSSQLSVADVMDEQANSEESAMPDEDEQAGSGNTATANGLNNDEWAVADKISAELASEFGNVREPAIKAQNFDCFGEKYVAALGADRLAALGITQDTYNSNPGLSNDEKIKSHEIMKECLGLKNVLIDSYQASGIARRDAECIVGKIDMNLYNKAIYEVDDYEGSQEFSTAMTKAAEECGVQF